ncbi:MAG: response regulator transcription factor [Rhodospirillaceae bacterium]
MLDRQENSAHSEFASFTKVRLFVADDHPLILESIKGVFCVLEPAAEVTGFVDINTLETALDQGLTPDLVLIDFGMPGLGSIESLSTLIARHPGHRLAIISGQADGQLARDVLNCGCHGFIPKSMGASAIYHAIRLMMTEGGRFLPDFLVEQSWQTSSPVTNPAYPPGRQKYGLTRREIEVLRTLATGKANKQIARELGIEEVTVKLHLRRGYAKLNVRNRIEAVRTVYQGALD